MECWCLLLWRISCWQERLHMLFLLQTTRGVCHLSLILALPSWGFFFRWLEHHPSCLPVAESSLLWLLEEWVHLRVEVWSVAFFHHCPSRRWRYSWFLPQSGGSRLQTTKEPVDILPMLPSFEHKSLVRNWILVSCLQYLQAMLWHKMGWLEDWLQMFVLQQSRSLQETTGRREYLQWRHVLQGFLQNQSWQVECTKQC